MAKPLDPSKRTKQLSLTSRSLVPYTECLKLALSFQASHMAFPICGCLARVRETSDVVYQTHDCMPSQMQVLHAVPGASVPPLLASSLSALAVHSLVGGALDTASMPPKAREIRDALHSRLSSRVTLSACRRRMIMLASWVMSIALRFAPG